MNLQTLEEQTTGMQTLIGKQQKQIQKLENAYQSTYLLYLNSENYSKQLETDMKKCKRSLRTWRTVGITSLVIVVTTMVVVGVIVNDAR